MRIYPVKSRRIKKFRNFKRILRVFDIIALNITYETYKSLIGDEDNPDSGKYRKIMDDLINHRLMYDTVMMKSIVLGLIRLRVAGTNADGVCYDIIGKNNVKIFPYPVISDDGTEMEIKLIKSEGEYSLIINNSKIHV